MSEKHRLACVVARRKMVFEEHKGFVKIRDGVSGRKGHVYDFVHYKMASKTVQIHCEISTHPPDKFAHSFVNVFPNQADHVV